MHERDGAPLSADGAVGRAQSGQLQPKLREADSRDERIADPFSEPDDLKPLELMPAIVVVVNELAELMAQGGKQVEERLAAWRKKPRPAFIWCWPPGALRPR